MHNCKLITQEMGNSRVRKSSLAIYWVGSQPGFHETSWKTKNITLSENLPRPLSPMTCHIMLPTLVLIWDEWKINSMFPQIYNPNVIMN